jgi:predicted O-methyltransferase YrrM
MYKFLLSIIPKRIKNSILGTYKEEIERNYDKYLLSIKAQQFDLPRLDLNQKHIRNLKVIEDRTRLLDFLPKNAVVAELGVDIGDFSSLIISKTNPVKIHLIDSWDTDRYSNSKKESVIARFEKEIENNLIEINIGYSIQVLEKFENNYFDWIYIDTDHSYKTTKNELNLASRKVKNNGIICGHDYYMGNWITGYRYGVIEAVHEFCIEYNWEIIYLTIEQSIPPSFAIRKIEL